MTKNIASIMSERSFFLSHFANQQFGCGGERNLRVTPVGGHRLLHFFKQYECQRQKVHLTGILSSGLPLSSTLHSPVDTHIFALVHLLHSIATECWSIASDDGQATQLCAGRFSSRRQNPSIRIRQNVDTQPPWRFLCPSQRLAPHGSLCCHAQWCSSR